MKLAIPHFLRSPNSAGSIGLEVSLEYVHLVQLCTNDNSTRLQAHASQPLESTFENLLTEPQTLTNTIRDALSQADFKNKNVVAAMPSTITRVMSVNYKVAAGQSDEQAITKLLLDRIGDELADFVPINHDQRVSERAALIAMCRRGCVMRFLDAVSRAGLTPCALEIGPVAIKRLVDALQHRQSNQSAIVVNCGRQKSYLTLISNRQLLSDDEVNFGEDTVIDRIVHALDVDTTLAHHLLRDADLGVEKPDDNTRTLIEIIRPELNQLVRDIERALVYATSDNRGNGETDIFLIGSLARWSGADRLISNILNRRVHTIANPLQPFLSLAEREAEKLPELAVATGLALRDMNHDCV